MYLFTIIAAAKKNYIDTCALPGGCSSPKNYDLTSILNLLFVVLGALAFLMVVIGGFRYVIAGGNPEEVKSARNTIAYALVGIVVIVLAAAIVNFVINRL